MPISSGQYHPTRQLISSELCYKTRYSQCANPHMAWNDTAMTALARLPDYSGQLVLPRNVHHQRPVLARPPVDLLGAPQELHAREVHAHRAPHLDHVAADGLDLLEVAAHLVVELGEPVGHPELEDAAAAGELVHVEGLHHALEGGRLGGRDG